jgi:DNA polymerase-3 subunit alpha
MPVAEPQLPYVEDWSNQDMLKGEKETLGFYISGHPLMRYERALSDFANADVDRLQNFHHGAQVTLGGIVMELNVRTTKKGDRFALFHLEDRFGSVKIVAWPDVFGKAGAVVQADAAVLVRGRLEIDDGGSMTVISDEIQSLDNIRERAARNIVVRVDGDSIDNNKVDRLHALLDSHRGDCSVVFEVDLPNGMMVRVHPNQFVRVKVTPELTNSIKEILGNCRVELVVQRASSAAS